MEFAKETTVPVDRSKAEIERTLARYGATEFLVVSDEDFAEHVGEKRKKRGHSRTNTDRKNQ